MRDIFKAAKSGSVHEITEILNENPDAIFLQDEEGNTPLHLAVKPGPFSFFKLNGLNGAYKFNAVKKLVQSGASLNIYNYYGSLPIDMTENLKIRDYLEENNPYNPKLTELQKAIYTGDEQEALQYIESDYELDTPDFSGKTPLHHAVIMGNLAIVKALVGKGVLLDSCDRMGCPPIYYAEELPEIKQFLEINNAHPFDLSLLEPDLAITELHLAAESGNLDEVREIVQKDNALVNATDRAGRTPLYSAIFNGRLDVMDELINSGALMNVSDIDMQSPLEYALMFGQYEAAIKCIVSGSEVNNYDKYGDLPIHIAAKNSQYDLIKALVAHGANVNEVDCFGRTPLELVVENNVKKDESSIDIIDFLLKNGADADRADLLQINIVEKAKAEADGEQKHTVLSKYLKRHVELPKEYLEDVSNYFRKIIEIEIAKAREQGKKLIVFLGELQGDFKIYQIEKRLMLILQTLGVNNLYTEIKGGFPIENLAERRGMFFQHIDTHVSRETASVDERNIEMAKNINSIDQDAVVITGRAHLRGLLTDNTSKIDANRYHVVPFNLSGICPSEIIDVDDKFACDPSRVIQIKLEKECFTSPELLSLAPIKPLNKALIYHKSDKRLKR